MREREPRAEEQQRAFYHYVRSPRAEAPPEAPPVRPLDIPDVVKGYTLSGGNIQNVVHYATIRATKRQAEESGGEADPPLVIYLEDVENGIKRELSKNGIPLSNKKQRSWDSQQRD